MMYAIGLPGEMPRCWFEGKRIEQAQVQLLPGEVISDDVTLDDNGRPIPAPLPAN